MILLHLVFLKIPKYKKQDDKVQRHCEKRTSVFTKVVNIRQNVNKCKDKAKRRIQQKQCRKEKRGEYVQREIEAAENHDTRIVYKKSTH